MGKKTKRLYGRMQHGLEKKRKHAESLMAKRSMLEASGDSGSKKREVEQGSVSTKKNRRK